MKSLKFEYNLSNLDLENLRIKYMKFMYNMAKNNPELMKELGIVQRNEDNQNNKEEEKEGEIILNDNEILCDACVAKDSCPLYVKLKEIDDTNYICLEFFCERFFPAKGRIKDNENDSIDTQGLL